MTRFAAAARQAVASDDAVIARSPRASLTLSAITPYNGVAGPRPALCYRDPLALVAALLAADGACDAMLLTPASLSDDALTALCAAAGVSGICADHARPATAVDGGERGITAEMTGRTRWLLTTSGTSGIPKIIEHDVASLSRTVHHSPALDAARWSMLYEPSRFAATQVLMQALLTGALLLLPDGEAPLPEQVGWLAREGCTHLSATPSQWRRVLMTREASSLPLRQITLGGEIADDRLLAALAARWPDARIAHIYAATEFGVGFSVHDGRAGFPASLVEDDRARFAVRDEQLMLHDGDSWRATGDRVRREADRYLFLGREGSAINVGGSKVFAEEVEQAVRQVPGVVDCHVAAVVSAIMGQLLTVSVVPLEGADPASLRSAIRQHCTATLPPPARPAKIGFVANIALTDAGKLGRPSA